jgi:hypothetical protein
VAPTTAFEAALRLIEPYVLRGDDSKSIRSGWMGTYSGDWAAKIGGWLYFSAAARWLSCMACTCEVEDRVQSVRALTMLGQTR